MQGAAPVQGSLKIFNAGEDVPYAPGEFAVRLREADLPGQCTHYYLGSNFPRVFMSSTGLDKLRRQLSMDCELASGDAKPVIGKVPLLIRPSLVFANKNAHAADSVFRARVFFDLDPPHTEFEAPDEINWYQLAETTLETLEPYFEDCEELQWVLLGNRFDDKHASAHLVICNRYWGANNKCPREFLPAINAALAPFALEFDASIATSGIKLPFSDKFIAGRQWRGNGMAVQAHSDNVTLDDWDSFWRQCDPAVKPSEAVMLDELNWTEPEEQSQPRKARRLVAPSAGPVQAVARSSGATLAARLQDRVPEWETFQTKRREGEAYQCLVPDQAFCPFKGEDHTANKCYAVCFPDGKLLIRCHAAQCDGQEMHLPAQTMHECSAEEMQHIEDYNCDWARVIVGSGTGGASIASMFVIELKASYDQPLHMMRVRDFHERMAYDTYKTLNARGKTVTKAKSKLWINSGMANAFNGGLFFDPSGAHSLNRFNIFRGWGPDVEGPAEIWRAQYNAAEDKPGYLQQLREAECDLIGAHIQFTICAGNTELTTYVWHWLAHMVQKPQEIAEVALVIMGPRGVGKSLLMTYVRRMFGLYHAWNTTHVGELFAKFNAFLEGKVFVAVDELMSGELARHRAQLQTMLSGERINIEQKFGGVRMAENYLHLAFLTNDKNVLPAGPDARRYQCIQARRPTCDDSGAYFRALAREMNGNGPAALRFILERLNLGDWHPRQIVLTDMLWREKIGNSHAIHQWWYEVLRDGAFDFSFFDENESLMLPNTLAVIEPGAYWGLELPKDAIYRAYCATNDTISQAYFWKVWREAVRNAPRITRPRINGQRYRCINLEPLDTYRSDFQDIYACDEGVWTLSM